MSTILLEQVFADMFDVPLAPEDIPTPQQSDTRGYRPRSNARQTTSTDERAYQERVDVCDIFGVSDYA